MIPASARRAEKQVVDDWALVRRGEIDIPPADPSFSRRR
jgi:hypothetical protein